MSRSNIKLLFISGFLLIHSACIDDPQADVSLKNTPYFDLKGLINEQVKVLDSLNPQVEMQAVISGEEESQTLRKDSADWAETLKLYAEADLNKPVLRDQYIVSDSSLQGSGLRLKLYQARRPGEVDIPYMKVYYQDSLPAVRRIEAFFREENPLYSTQRNMSLRFEEQGGRVLLTGYTTLGKQKMIFRDSILYRNVGQIRY